MYYSDCFHPYPYHPVIPPNRDGGGGWFWLAITTISVLILSYVFLDAYAFGAGSGARIPGSDESTKLEAAGTLLRLVDTALFKWGARLFAGLCIMSSAWSLKEQRFGIAIICIVGAIIFGTAPTWVRNIFDISASDSVFGFHYERPPYELFEHAERTRDV